MSVNRWVYRDTKDLICMHVASSDNTTSVKTDSKQVEYRFTNAAGTEFKWHRPAEAGSELTGKAIFPVDITTQDKTRMSQLKLYLNYSPLSAYRDSVTHIVCDIKSSRAINGLELICGFLIQANENGDPSYGNNQTLQWEVFREPINLVAGKQTFIRAIPADHIKKQADAQVFQPRHSPFYYWRMEGANTFQPGDEIEFSFRFVSQPFIDAPIGTRAS
nr:hypothetical protein [Paenibacillus xylanexedens]